MYENVQMNPMSWEINTDNLHWVKRLGQGHFGEVWHASTKKEIQRHPKGKDFAVKKLKGKVIKM